MESRTIQLTPSAHKYGNLNIRPCGKDFFPPDVFGGSSRKAGLGVPITLEVDGLPNPIQTDIPKDTAGRPRWLFRERTWVKQFIRLNNLVPGHTVTISRLGKRKYKIGYNNNRSKTAEKEPAKTKHETTKKLLDIDYKRTCDCQGNKINCLTAKEWLKCQLGVWQFSYTKRDIRDKKIHPATFPISLATKVIELFSHKGDLILDPFTGSSTTLLAAQDTGRNAVGFDLKKEYVNFSINRLKKNAGLFADTKQIVVHNDARKIADYLPKNSVKCIFTSPPYANLLNRERKNKSRRNRKNEQLGKIEQYSQDPRDLGTMALEEYTKAMGEIFENLLPILVPKGHCVINIPDMWWQNQRITLHTSLIQELRKRGYELRNIIIWDRTNLVNGIGIFGWPSNYITMGVTFEYLLDFWRPPS